VLSLDKYGDLYRGSINNQQIIETFQGISDLKFLFEKGKLIGYYVGYPPIFGFSSTSDFITNLSKDIELPRYWKTYGYNFISCDGFYLVADRKLTWQLSVVDEKRFDDLVDRCVPIAREINKPKPTFKP